MSIALATKELMKKFGKGAKEFGGGVKKGVVSGSDKMNFKLRKKDLAEAKKLITKKDGESSSMFNSRVKNKARELAKKRLQKVGAGSAAVKGGLLMAAMSDGDE